MGRTNLSGGLVALMAMLAMAAPAAARQVICTPFVDELEELDGDRWLVSHGWTNGGMVNAGWSKENAQLADGRLSLVLNDRPSSSRPYTGAEIQTHGFAGYGRFEVRMKPARGIGTVSSFFIYTGPHHGDPMDELDIEFLGKDTTRMQLNYFTDGKGGKEKMIDLGFDAADSFNDYAIEWHPDAIRWFVNGRQVHEERGARGPLPETPGKIIANIWNGTGVDEWLGRFKYPGEPLVAVYDRISYTPFKNNQVCGEKQKK